MFNTDTLVDLLPLRMRNKIDSYIDALGVVRGIRDRRVLRSLAPAGFRGLVQQRGKQSASSNMPASHSATFAWTYPGDQPEMQDLYQRAKTGQWVSEDLPWHLSVDPFNTESPILPQTLVNTAKLEEVLGVRLTAKEKASYTYCIMSWMMSQFLHGEQGALFAAAQVTQAVEFFDGKLYGASQVMDEARHVEVFRRYLSEKLNKLYQVNDNLYTILDSLMSDSRWDMKFLGMQIMVEGLALGAFGYLYQHTGEPLLRELLKNVIQDEARHVHYGVVALREHLRELSESERRERENWCFEVGLLMRNRFIAYEVYDELYADRLSREKWREYALETPLLTEFTQLMFRRLIPNLREIGLLSPRIAKHYDRAGLLEYSKGRSAVELTSDQILHDLSGPNSSLDA